MHKSKFKILYDGGCPLCQREVNFLKNRDLKGNLEFVDIDDANFSSEMNYGITYKAAMGRIHAIDENGNVIKDIDVFRKAYKLIGMGWVYAPTEWPVICEIFNYIYILWAKYRLKLTFRPSLSQLCIKKGLD